MRNIHLGKMFLSYYALLLSPIESYFVLVSIVFKANHEIVIIKLSDEDFGSKFIKALYY